MLAQQECVKICNGVGVEVGSHRLLRRLHRLLRSNAGEDAEGVDLVFSSKCNVRVQTVSNHHNLLLLQFWMSFQDEVDEYAVRLANHHIWLSPTDRAHSRHHATASTGDDSSRIGVRSICVGRDKSALVIADVGRCTAHFDVVDVAVQSDDDSANVLIHLAQNANVLLVVVFHSDAADADPLELVIDALFANHVGILDESPRRKVVRSRIGGARYSRLGKNRVRQNLIGGGLDSKALQLLRGVGSTLRGVVRLGLMRIPAHTMKYTSLPCVLR